MALQSFNDLSNAVANWMGRSGAADFTGNVPDFILLCESRLNYGSDDEEFSSPPLRVAQMEIPATTLTILASSNTVALPNDFLEMRRLYLQLSPRNKKLSYVTPNQMDTFAPPNLPVTTIPSGFYTIQGNNIVVPASLSTAQTLVMGYYQKIPALTATNTTNWLMAAYPNVYLTGSQLEGAIFVRDLSDIQLMGRLFTAHVRGLRKSDLKGRYSGDALQMRTDTGNP